MCSHKISLWTPRRTCGLTCLHGISCGASPPLYQPPLDLQAHRHNNPWCSPPRAPPATPWCSPSWAPAATPTPPTCAPGRPPMPIQPGLLSGKKHRRPDRSGDLGLCRSLPLVRPRSLTRTKTDLTPLSSSPALPLLPLDYGLRTYTPQVPAQPPAAPIRLARERHSPLALISNCPSTRRARRYICHSAAASTPGAPIPIETDYPLEFSEDTTYWRTTPRRCPPATTGPPWQALGLFPWIPHPWDLRPLRFMPP